MANGNYIFVANERNRILSKILDISAAIVDSKLSSISLIILDGIGLLQYLSCIHKLWENQNSIVDIVYQILVFPRITAKYASSSTTAINLSIFCSYFAIRIVAFLGTLTLTKQIKGNGLSKFNYIIMYCFETILAIPFFYFLLQLAVNPSNQIAGLIIMLVCCFIAIILSVISFHFITSYYFNSNLYTKWQPPSMRYMKLLKCFLLALMVQISSSNAIFSYVILSACILIDLIIIITASSVFLMMSCTAYVMITTSSISTIIYILCTFIFQALSSSFTISSLFILLISFAVISVIVYVRNSYAQNLSESNYDASSDAYISRYMQSVCKICKSRDSYSKFSNELIKLYQLHVYKCSDSQCSCKKSASIVARNISKLTVDTESTVNIDESYSEWKKIFKGIFESFCTKNEKSILCKISYAAYYKIVERNFFKSYFIIADCIPISTGLTFYFIIYKEILRINNSIQQSESKLKLEIKKIAIYEHYFDLLSTSIEKALENVICFYNYLLISIDKSDSLMSIGLKITYSIVEFFSNFQKSIAQFNDSISVLKMYSKFNKNVLQNDLEADCAFERAQGIERTMQINRRMRAYINQAYSHNSDTLVVAISGMEGKLGIVELVNNSVSILGYEKSEVRQSNVTHIMPNVIAQEHNEFLRSFLRTGNSILLGTPRIVFAQCRNGLILPIQLYLRTFPDIQDGFHVIGFISFEKSLMKHKFNRVPYELTNRPYNFILSSSNSIIQGLSEGAAKIFGLKPSFFQSNKNLFTEPISLSKLIANYNNEDVNRMLESGTEIVLNVSCLYKYLDKDSVSYEEIESIKKSPDIKAYVYKYNEEYHSRLKLIVLLIIECSKKEKEKDVEKSKSDIQLDMIELQSIASSSQNTASSSKQEARESKTNIISNKSPRILVIFERLYIIMVIEMLLALMILYLVAKFLLDKNVPQYRFLIHCGYATEYHCIAPQGFLSVANIDNNMESSHNSISDDRRSEAKNLSLYTNDQLKEKLSILETFYLQNAIQSLITINYQNNLTEYYYSNGFLARNSTFQQIAKTMISILASTLNQGSMNSTFYTAVFNFTNAQSNFTNFMERGMLWVERNSINQPQDKYIQMRYEYLSLYSNTLNAINNYLLITMIIQITIIVTCLSISLMMLNKLKSCFNWIFSILAELNASDIRDHLLKLKEYSSSTEKNKVQAIDDSTYGEENTPLIEKKFNRGILEADEQFKSRQRAKIKKNKYSNLKQKVHISMAFLFMAVITFSYYIYLSQIITSMDSVANYNLNVFMYRYLSLGKSLTIIKYKLLDKSFNITYIEYFLKRCKSVENIIYNDAKSMPVLLSSMKDVISQHDSPEYCDAIKSYISNEHFSKCRTIHNGILNKGLKAAIEKVLASIQNYKMIIETNSTVDQMHNQLASVSFSEIEDLYLYYIRVGLDIQLQNAISLMDSIISFNEANFLIMFIFFFIAVATVCTLILWRILFMVKEEILSYRGLISTLKYDKYYKMANNSAAYTLFK